MYYTKQPKVLAKMFLFSASTLIGTMKDLWKLTYKPIETAKVCSRHFRNKSYFASVGMMSNVSSSYCIVGYACP
jgi:hypothetical protein